MPFFSWVASSASVVPPCEHSWMKAASSGLAGRRMHGQRVLGRHGAKGHAHDGVDPGGEHVHAAIADQRA